jgi:c-di-GMP-binding flagellar brake protein YcgR
MTTRRKIPRQPARWSGAYRFEGDRTSGPRRCRVLDISAAGAGLQLLDTTIEESTHQMIVVNLELHGDMRSAVPWEDDSVRVGVEFGELEGAAAHFVKQLRSYECKDRW